MKPFAALAVLRVDPAVLAQRMRDRLVEVGAALDDVESIAELERVEAPDGVRILNRWIARQRVPTLMQGWLGADEISWLDRAFWHADGSGCDWSIQPSIGADRITCAGTTRFEPAMGGKGVRVRFDGSLEIDPAFIAGISGPLQRPVTALVESIATTLIPKNLRAAAEATARLD